MAKYSGFGQSTAVAADTHMNLFGSGAIRPSIYDILIGSDATPADNAYEFSLGRTTAIGTEGSGFTPVALDPLTVAATGDFGIDHAAEPTYTANAELLDIGLNQRATFRWVAAPGGELIATATNANGIGLLCVTVAGSGVNINTTMMYEE